MSLALDARQRAMLLEMGVRVWQPVTALEPEAATLAAPAPAPIPDNTAAEAAPAAALPAVPDPAARSALPASPDATVRPPIRPPSPTRLTELPEGIANMDWPALAGAVQHCQACAMCLGRRTPVLAPPQAAMACDWLVLGDPPDEPEERAERPFVEEAGQLLDNMLRAVGVQRWDHAANAATAPAPSSRAYLTHVLKCRPALMRAPDAAELGTCAHFLRREIALTQPRVILAMGRFAMQLLLSETPPEQARLPLGKLRGQVWRFAGVPVVVTYPPVYLLRNGHDKARAWADLCLARAVASGSLATP
ncbi:uracil-DNA glycosylase [Rhodoferax sp.]|uniref:uracil-DNA glycosylase n=1 Tax=Rhodoferax sp. TaxID=50421 RepID=UPI0025ED132C|nr:uracil-DNA glycosylase [Rhodoferax sp.]